MRFRFLVSAGFATILAGSATPALAELFTLDENIKPVLLTLRDYGDGTGAVWTAANGVSTGGTDYVSVGGLSPLRAVEAYVLSLSDSDDVSMTLARAHWEDELDSCTTGADGMCGARFRTHGEVGFKINAPEGAAWAFVLLTSPEVPIDTMIGSPLFDARRADAARYENAKAGAESATPAADASGADSSKGWTMPAVIALLVIVAVLLVLLLRKKNSTAVLVLLGIALASVPQSPARAVSESTAGTLDALGDQLDDVQSRNQEDAAVRSRVDGNIATLQNRMAVLLALQKLAHDHEKLSNCVGIAAPAGSPRIPTFCEGSEECQSCYSTARAKFNQVRGTFEQLRVIYSCGMQEINSALAFGDTASGVHGVVGLAWKAERTKIEKSVETLQKAYDSKYADLDRRLYDSMIELGMCEAQYGEPDWYDRFGYMYYEFLTDKYKRSD